MEWLVTGKSNNAQIPPEDMEIDRLISLIYARQPEFTAEHFAALQLLLDGLRARAATRFQQPLQNPDKQ